LPGPEDRQFIVFYGSLMKDFGRLDELGIRQAIHYIGPCEVAGTLVDLGEYPGLVPGEGIVQGEMFEISDLESLKALDRFEEYSPTEKINSLYIRLAIHLLKPDKIAWVYIYNQDVSNSPVIESGDWKQYCAYKNKG
jgi:gamma-glutamylcyclotransferase (GGCT)/AIG2-like uncharacterized protein YtfP